MLLCLHRLRGCVWLTLTLKVCSTGITRFLECCIKLIKILLLHWTLEGTICANEQIGSQVLPLGDYQIQLLYKSNLCFANDAYECLQPYKQDYPSSRFCVVCAHISTDIVVKATEHPKYVLFLQVQVYYLYYQNIYGSFISVLETNIWHSTIFKFKKRFCPLLTSEEMIRCCCSFSTYLKEHSLNHTEILNHGGKRV